MTCFLKKFPGFNKAHNSSLWSLGLGLISISGWHENSWSSSLRFPPGSLGAFIDGTVYIHRIIIPLELHTSSPNVQWSCLINSQQFCGQLCVLLWSFAHFVVFSGTCWAPGRCVDTYTLRKFWRYNVNLATSVFCQTLAHFFRIMNSPQRTACLAKSGKNVLIIRGHFSLHRFCLTL